MSDTIERIGGSTLQHGPANHRIYVMHAEAEDLDALHERIDTLLRERRYSKVFAKVATPLADSFAQRGYQAEAVIPQTSDCGPGLSFLSRFVAPERAQSRAQRAIDKALALARQAAQDYVPLPLDDAFAIYRAAPADAEDLAELYGTIFASYPFPVDDPDFLRRNMAQDVRYFAVRRAGDLVAASAAEMDPAIGTVEMTDFATRPEVRGHGLATTLLATMDEAMTAAGFRLGYTIARALSAGMNVAFARAGYRYAGTLVNNTQIAGDIESMNVWYRDLTAHSPQPRA